MSRLVAFLEKYKINVEITLVTLFAASLALFAYLMPGLLGTALDALVIFGAVWLPLLLGYIFWQMYVIYIRRAYIASQDYVLLEIRLPREIARTPRAMEAVLDGLHIKPGETTFIDKWIKGKIRPWYSLELVSIGGAVRFFIWTRAFFRKQVETQVYGQYPEVEIAEVDDYTDAIPKDLDGMNLWGANYILSNSEEPLVPIRTYIDYGLDNTAEKEETKVDPLATTLEALSSLTPGEQMWIQIMIQVPRTKWEPKARELIEKIKQDATPAFFDPSSGAKGSGFPNPTEEQREKMKALTRKISKVGFDCGIRGIYIATEDAFDPARISALNSIPKQFNSNYLNGFRPDEFLAKFDFPWQDFTGRRKLEAKKEVFDAYKRRSFFYPPYAEEPFILNTEELATLFHFPGRVAQAPTLGRIPSRRAAPPTNLPSDG